MEEGEEDPRVSSLITDLEETLNNESQQSSLHFHLSTLQNLISLLNTNDSQILSQFLSSKSLSLSSLLPSLTSAMDSDPTHLSLLSSKIYPSLPPIPLFSLFSLSFPLALSGS
jgi:condensin-2 complex subunit D3